MRLTVEFDSLEEFESFRSSARKVRGKGIKDDVEEQPVATQPAPVQTAPSPPTPSPQPVAPAPVAPPAQSFAPAAIVPSHGFPGANGATPPALHPLAVGIIEMIDSALAKGQQPDVVLNWFRHQIGPEAANATLEQIKSILIPRLSEAHLRQIAAPLGVPG